MRHTHLFQRVVLVLIEHHNLRRKEAIEQTYRPAYDASYNLRGRRTPSFMTAALDGRARPHSSLTVVLPPRLLFDQPLFYSLAETRLDVSRVLIGEKRGRR